MALISSTTTRITYVSEWGMRGLVVYSWSFSVEHLEELGFELLLCSGFIKSIISIEVDLLLIRLQDVLGTLNQNIVLPSELMVVKLSIVLLLHGRCLLSLAVAPTIMMGITLRFFQLWVGGESLDSGTQIWEAGLEGGRLILKWEDGLVIATSDSLVLTLKEFLSSEILLLFSVIATCLVGGCAVLPWWCFIPVSPTVMVLHLIYS